jgi:hypothetical protein
MRAAFDRWARNVEDGRAKSLLTSAGHLRAEGFIMQPARTLIGAIVGAALGVALLYLAYRLAGPFALLTGLGVRVAIAGNARASYLRGAITALLALGAYLGGWFVVAAVARHRAADVTKPHISADADAQAGDSADAKGASDAAVPAPTAAPLSGPQQSGGSMHQPLPKQFQPWDFIALAVAALIAYELGRGSDERVRTAEHEAPAGAVPMGTHPDA